MAMSKKRESYHGCPANSLPNDVLHIVLEKLAIHSWSCFAKVCKSWRRITEEAYCRKPERWCCPWLVVQDNKDEFRTSLSNIAFCSVIEDERKLWYNKLNSLANIPTGHLDGSCQDWMIVCHYETEDSTDCFFSLINPFTDTKITLPIISDIEECIHIHKLLVSTSPSDPNCIYMCFSLISNPKLYLCTQQSQMWFDTSPKFLESGIVDATVSEQSFHILTHRNGIMSLKFSDALKSIKQLEEEDEEEGQADMDLRCLRIKMTDVATTQDFALKFKYLIESCGDLLLVERFINYGVTNFITTKFKLYRLESTNTYNHKWVICDGLGEDVILFMSRASKILLNAKDLGIAEGNSVYFVDQDDKPKTYSFKNNIFGSFSYNSLIQHTQHPIWLSAPLRWYLYDDWSHARAISPDPTIE